MESKELLKSREEMYRLLSRLYLLEVDAPLLTALKEMKYPKESPQEELTEGYRLLEEYLLDSRPAEEIIEELAADYARVFLAAGIAQGKAAFPFASVYASKRHLMMQESQNDAADLYAAKGLKPRKDMYRVPEDHLGLLLEYMACLCAEAQAVPGEEAYENVKRCQKEFLKNHLISWVPVFSQELVKYAETGFYQGLGKLTKGFLILEQRLYEE